MHINIFLKAACKVLVVQPTHSGFCFLQPPLWFSDPLEARMPKTEILIEKVNNPCSNTAPHQEPGIQLSHLFYRVILSVIFAL